MPVPPDDHSTEPSGCATDREVSLRLDLLRADLYRILDEVVRAPSEQRDALVREFERLWVELKDAAAAEP